MALAFSLLLSGSVAAVGNMGVAEAAVRNVTISAVSQSAGTVLGMWTVIQSGGVTVKTGFTPLTFAADTAKSYTVTVSDYQDIVFDHWGNGSTSRTRALSAQDISLVAYYRTGSQPPATSPPTFTLTVRSADLAGNAFGGMWTAVQSSSGAATLKTGFTPLSYAGPAGTYLVTPSDYQDIVFDHWENGSTSRTRAVAVSADVIVTAYYRTKPAAPAPQTYSLTVRSVSLNGTEFAGMWTVIQPAGSSQALTGFTPFKQAVSSDKSYTVAVDDYRDIVFDHWENGSTSKSRTFTPGGNAVMTAYYRTAALALYPASGVAGTVVTAAGANFAPNSQVTVTYDEKAVATLSANPAGSFNATFAVPSTAAGKHLVQAAGANGWKASATFQDVTPPPSISVSPTSGPGGSTLAAVTGANFSPGSTITVTYDSAVVATAAADATGSFSATFAVPAVGPGSHTIRATESDQQQQQQQLPKSAAATFEDTASYHPLSQIIPKTGVYVPLFMYPGSSGFTQWQKVIDAKNAHPSVPIVVAINPSSGPGGSKDINFVNGIAKLKAADIVVLGYTYDSYGSRPISAVKADIDKYNKWYGVDGIFLDEVSNSAAFAARYEEVDAYADALGMKMTMGNPGADVPPSFMGTLDTFSISEGPGYPPMSWLQYCAGCTTSGWHDDYDKRNFVYIRYAVSTLDTAYVAESAKWVGLMYLTNDGGSNPWDTVPSYFDTLVTTLDK